MITRGTRPALPITWLPAHRWTMRSTCPQPDRRRRNSSAQRLHLEERSRPGPTLEKILLEHPQPDPTSELVDRHDPIVLDHVARSADLTGRLPDDVARPHVPGLQPHSQHREPRA